MQNILAYDVDVEEIDRVCDINNVSNAEVIEALMDYLPQVCADNGWDS